MFSRNCFCFVPWSILHVNRLECIPNHFVFLLWGISVLSPRCVMKNDFCPLPGWQAAHIECYTFEGLSIGSIPRSKLYIWNHEVVPVTSRRVKYRESGRRCLFLIVICKSILAGTVLCPNRDKVTVKCSEYVLTIR